MKRPIFHPSHLFVAAFFVALGALWNVVSAQLPVTRGLSTTRTGMLYYDHTTATDQRDRVYRYTLLPDSAGCIWLDFNLVENKSAAQDSLVQFIRVLEGNDANAKVVAELGAVSKVVQVVSPRIVVEFTRNSLSRSSIWTLQWQTLSPAHCQQPLQENACADVQDICGPVYREHFPSYGPDGPQALESLPGACVERQHNASWYRFVAAQDGQLAFDIVPQNGFDDFDWVLLQGDRNDPSACPERTQTERQRACNYASGRGPQGATGMGERGESLRAGASDCPYAQRLPVHKGDVFFLLIDDFSHHSTGFEIRFNEVVMQCENPKRDLLQIEHKEALGSPPADPRRTFSQYTRVLRLDLTEKANAHLAEAALPTDLFAVLPQGSKPIAESPLPAHLRGLPQVLLQGLKYGAIRAYAAEDFVRPIHYGDLLTLAERSDSGAPRPAAGTWWTPSADRLAPFCQQIELIVDEKFDKVSGAGQSTIRYLRMTWRDPNSNAPDYYVVVFAYEEVRALLDRVNCGNRHNDVGGFSLRDALESHTYSARMVGRAGKSTPTAQQAQVESTKVTEMPSFHWEK